VGIANENLAPRYPKFVQKLFGMKGPQSTPQISGEIAVTMNVFAGVENRFLESWDVFAGANGNVPNVAGVAGVKIRNPGGSNVIAVVERLSVSANIAGSCTIELAINATDYVVTSNAAQAMDGRQRPRSTLITTTTNAATTGATLGANTAIDFAILGINQPPVQLIVVDDQEFVVSPGWALQVLGVTNNQSITFSIKWRERLLEESERQ